MTSTREDVEGLRAAAQAALEVGRHEEARERFAAAAALSCEVLPVTDPARLALAGMHADAWFEHWNDTERAFEIARAAYDDAVEGIEDAGEHRRATVGQLSELRDRLTYWAFRMETS